MRATTARSTPRASSAPRPRGRPPRRWRRGPSCRVLRAFTRLRRRLRETSFRESARSESAPRKRAASMSAFRCSGSRASRRTWPLRRSAPAPVARNAASIASSTPTPELVSLRRISSFCPCSKLDNVWHHQDIPVYNRFLLWWSSAKFIKILRFTGRENFSNFSSLIICILVEITHSQFSYGSIDRFPVTQDSVVCF